MAEFDAIAIGGGLAGSAFAFELARHGARVAVIERTPSAQLKVCGDFLSAEAQHLLSYLGLNAANMGATCIETFRLATGEQVALQVALAVLAVEAAIGQDDMGPRVGRE